MSASRRRRRFSCASYVERELRPAALALGAMSAVAALVAGQRTAGLELEDAADDRVEEGAVVGDDDDRPGEAAQPLLEPAQAVAVEVVGRLVEEQHGRRAPAACRQQRARLLAARQPRQRRARVEVVDAQRAARLVERRLQGPAAERLEALLRVAVALERGGRRVALGQPRQQRVQLAAHGPQLAQPGAEQLAEGRARVRRLLRQPADALARRRWRPRRDRGDRPRPAAAAASTCPTPLGPTRPARSPSPSTNERPSKSGAPSWAFVRSDACNMWSSCVVVRPEDSGRGKRDGHARGVSADAGLPTAPPHARAHEVVPRRPEIVCGGCLLHRWAA